MAIDLIPISTLPTPPTKADPNNFSVRADDFLGALPEFQVEMNMAITELNKITSGLDQATPIAAWAVGTTYDFPDVVAGSDGYSYRCIDTAVVGEDPVTDNGTHWVNLSIGRSPIPVGIVVAFIGGYFTTSANTGFTSTIGNTAATLNSVLNPDGWYVCNGAALNSSSSPIFNGSGRRLPNLTDDRFLMGDGDYAAGSTGGSSTMAHTHSTDIASFTSGATTLTIAQMPAHTHPSSATSTPLTSLSCGAGAKEPSTRGSATGSTGGGGSHIHTVNPPATTSGAASLTENRPKFLSCFYIMKAV